MEVGVHFVIHICTVYWLVSHKTAPCMQICCWAITWRWNNSRLQLGPFLGRLCHSRYPITIIINPSSLGTTFTFCSDRLMRWWLFWLTVVLHWKCQIPNNLSLVNCSITQLWMTGRMSSSDLWKGGRHAVKSIRVADWRTSYYILYLL